MKPRLSPIVWGVLFAAFCVWVAEGKIYSIEIGTEVWLSAVAILLGLILLGVGVLTVWRGRDQNIATEEAVSQPEEQ